MEERKIEELVKSIDTEITPPYGLKQKVFANIEGLNDNADLILNPVERFIFEKPLWIAGGLSASISGLLWAIMGSNFANLVNGLIR